ncbi:siroheme synthase [Paenibacillus sp. CAA11]|uniref:precorrin-2 dehydrogenase/sirohydrochlorin ferrochelatase family protein n=1 Tax=Paenibacillus sp. CAA11 TaxID=1532905 RepID=UPI000D3C9D58|nr:bifunctional precorrin-2 dehydrogenase/sirohydrochlorin ferrochelatase [Paenibacillus sp. CAA11]AWB45737.1 siroheme synthase [Paenibacillus sp. CAA11]
MTNFIPIMLNVEGVKAVIVGGGGVAARKAEPLWEAGADLIVISPALGPVLHQAAQENKITWLSREYRNGDLAEAGLAFAATDNPEVNEMVAAEAKKHAVPVNVASRAQSGNFITPSVLRRGDLVISVSTSGAGPAAAVRITEDLKERYGEEYEEYLAFIKRVRSRVKDKVTDRVQKARLLHSLTEAQWLERVRDGSLRDWGEEEIDRWMTKG